VNGQSVKGRVRITKFQAGFFVLVLFSAALTAQGQQASNTEHEVWPEIQIFIPLSERFRLFIMVREQRSAEALDKSEGVAGLHLDYFWKNKWLLRTGYRYRRSFGPRPVNENRWLFEGTYSQPLPKQFTLRDRSVEEFRWLNGNFSTRFRNRAMLERKLGLGKRSLVPYAAGEIFYDTRFDSFNRYRVTTGVRILFKETKGSLLNLRRQRTLDVYYAWQHDTRALPARVQALGIILGINF